MDHFDLVSREIVVGLMPSPFHLFMQRRMIIIFCPLSEQLSGYLLIGSLFEELSKINSQKVTIKKHKLPLNASFQGVSNGGLGP